MNKSLEMAQKKVEARNFDIRKQILKYDDVMNDQRKVIFEQRLDIMGEDDVSETVKDLRHQLVNELVRTVHSAEPAYAEQWNTRLLRKRSNGVFGLDLPIDESGPPRKASPTGDHRAHPQGSVDDKAAAKAAELGARPTSARSRRWFCCRRSTICGASISSRSSICVR